MFKQNELAYKILSCIKAGMPISMISNLLNINYDLIYQNILYLKMYGYNIGEKYYSNGDIIYELVYDKDNIDNKNVLITDSNEEEVDLLLISDLHMGSYYEDFNLLDEVYNYALSNNIHVILNLGDLLEGTVNIHNIKVPLEEQVCYVLEKYPKVKEIISFILLGNHDYSLLSCLGQDVGKYITNIRGDLISLGYGFSDLKVKNDDLILEHSIKNNKITANNLSNKIIIRGHGHEARIKSDGNNYIINLPSLSHLNFNSSSFPGFAKMKLCFKSGNITNIIVDELIFINYKIYDVNEIKLFTGKNKNYKNDQVIENEEDIYKVYKK